MSSFYLFIFFVHDIVWTLPRIFPNCKCVFDCEKTTIRWCRPRGGKKQKEQTNTKQIYKKKVLKLMEKNIDYNMNLKWGD